VGLDPHRLAPAGDTEKPSHSDPEAHRKKPEHAKRFEETDGIGAAHDEAEDLKQGGPSPSNDGQRIGHTLNQEEYNYKWPFDMFFRL